MGRIKAWIKVNGASVLGIIQAFVKFFKEIATAIINLLSIIAPQKSQKFILAMREWLNRIDKAIDVVKNNLIPS